MKTFYRPEMVVDADSYSMSPLKPKLMAEWISEFKPESITSFEPATIEQIKLAHNPHYVDNVMSCKYPNGFGNVRKDVADSLLYTVGSMIAAVRYSASQSRGAVFSPTSGFHHAGYDDGGGFCTFNGLIIALMVAKQEGLIDTALIIDGDEHWGDGTDVIIKKLKLDWITHFSSRKIGDEYIKDIEKLVRHRRNEDIIIYQAGADIHENDPLGGRLTTEQMYRRDDLIRGYLAKPYRLVWNLAGGYQVNKDGQTIAEKLEPVMKLHRQTYERMVLEGV